MELFFQLIIISTLSVLSSCDIFDQIQDDLSLEYLKSCLIKKGTQNSVLVSRGSQRYEDLNYQWNIRNPENIQPLAILAVNNAIDISNAIRCARKSNIRIVAKSGGHSYEKYSFGDNNTVVIDLINLNEINVRKAFKTAKVGSGVTIARLYWTIWNKGKFGIPGGTCLTVGSAGLTLGGGIGYLTNRYGLTLDKVLEMEVVDANGNILNANYKHNTDLFWALRGAGGGNFGIVTWFKYELFDASTVKFVLLKFQYEIAKFSKVFKAWGTWIAKNKDSSTFSRLIVDLTMISIHISDADLSSEDVENLKKKFPPDTSAVTTVVSHNFLEFVTTISEFPHLIDSSKLKNVNRHDIGKVFFWAKSYMSYKIPGNTIADQLSQLITKIPEKIYIQFTTLGGAINKIGRNATAYVHRNSLYEVQIANIANNTNIVKWVEEFDTLVLATLDNGESYQNYMDGSLKDFLRRYYGSNLERLVQIKQKLDPDNFFRFPQSIPVVLQSRE